MHLADRSFSLSPHNAGHTVVGGRIALAGLRKRVCIIGAGIGAYEAPLDDPSWDVWTCNLIAPVDREKRLRADRWFDIHQRVAQTEDDLRWIAKCPMPIYVPPDLMDASPNAVRYPLDEVEWKLGGYWACTFAYQIALALYEDIATEIGLFGVELAWGTKRERTVEWANVAYWIGRAEERGVRFTLPSNSTLGRHVGRYGFEYIDEKHSVERYLEAVELIHEER